MFDVFKAKMCTISALTTKAAVFVPKTPLEGSGRLQKNVRFVFVFVRK